MPITPNQLTMPTPISARIADMVDMATPALAAAIEASDRALDWACTDSAVSCSVWVIFWNSFSNGRAKAVAVLASTPTIEPTTSIASWKSLMFLARTCS